MVDAVIINGDISYASGYLAVWDFFLDMLSRNISSKVTLLTTVGNHEMNLFLPPEAEAEVNNDSGGECGLSTVLIPLPSPASLQSPWWSYNMGIVHFIGLSTEHDFTAGNIM